MLDDLLIDDGPPWSSGGLSQAASPDRRPGAGDEVWQAVANTTDAHVAILDRRGRILAVNDAWRSFGRANGATSDHVGDSYLRVCDEADDPIATEVVAALRAMLSGDREGFDMVYPCHAPWEQRWFRVRARWAEDPRPLIVVSHRCVTDLHLSAVAARRRGFVLDAVNLAVVTTDVRGVILTWNPAATRLFGWTWDESAGRPFQELLAPGLPPGALGEVGEDGWERDLTLVRRDGSVVPAYVQARLMRDHDGQDDMIVLTFLDITRRVESARALERARNHLLAVTDSMGEGMYTLDLEGRLTFMNRAAQQLLGWTFDELAGQVMHDIIQPSPPPTAADAPRQRPIARATDDGEAVRCEDDLFLRADGTPLPVAYTATPLQTEAGAEGCVVVFEDITERKAEAERLLVKAEKLEWVRRIREALDRDLFELYAQPVARLADDAIVQHELLLRMHDAAHDGGVISPHRFLPIAEELGFVREIDRWVIDRAAALAAEGRTVHVNISALSVGEPWLMPHIGRAIERHGLDPSSMVFEITETALVQDERESRRFAERLHELGCRVALDDFGAGYSGFRYLKQLPLDYLKIDIEFVRDLAENPASRSVIEAVVSLARKFHLQTVAEGVEDAATYALVRELGVDYAQGYHIGRPASIEPLAEAA